MNGNFCNIMGAFHLTKTSGLNSQQLKVMNGKALSKIFEKEDNLTWYPKICDNFFLKLFFSPFAP